ncbi:terminase large subunit [Noviherbaspirillum suwonense]|uniref:Phage terminase-like protein, large subunit, contains N-terminal HTH domain n=1 Tax=Noviherbaspirillum suwonense TaxID=1224511 RepID=A0ABY1QLB7_9BURK|nr:terminase large subunit [Noviherbaspirillum suwonense]SMP71900.1 Phage terminase-like protein, large subunit, contains N-terminal HTH domain [Noviherbaspirillum suwonense]
MKKWTTACKDWERRLVAGKSIIPPPIFADQAEQALAIFKELRVVDLPGKPTFGECSEQWVFDFVAAIFGAYDAEEGKQLIREFFLLISKKNTKSTIAAGIMLTAVILCWREEEEHLILAPTKEVADNSFKPAAGMIRADEELSALFHIQDHIRTITHRVTRASLKVVAADTDTVSGKKSGRILVDEHWLFGARANANAMFMEATGGQVSRDEGWVIFLTTQSDQPPAGVFKEKLQYYRDVRDGKIEDRKSLGVIYEFPDAMIKSKAYLDPANFYITNPNIGRSVSAEWLEDQLKKNQAKKDGSFNQFLAKHLNVEIGMNLRSDRWTGADFWQQQARPAFTLQELIERSEVITVGIDGGGLDDLLGLAAVGREAGTGRWILWVHAWAHPIALERRKSEESKYLDFQNDGDLTIIDTLPGDVAQVAEVVAEIYASGKLASVGLDPEKTHKIMFQALIDAGIPEEICFAITQGWKLVGPITVAERKLAEGVLIHAGQAMMTWCVGNARTVPHGNAVSIDKQASGTAKIDPLMAMFNAVSLMSLNPEAVGSYGEALANPIKILRRS